MEFEFKKASVWKVITHVTSAPKDGIKMNHHVNSWKILENKREVRAYLDLE